MSRPSKHDAGALRNWIRLSVAADLAVQNSKAFGVEPLSSRNAWLILGHLAVQPDGAASYADVARTMCHVSAVTFSRMVNELTDVRYLARYLASDNRHHELIITADGRSALDHLLAPPKSVIGDIKS